MKKYKMGYQIYISVFALTMISLPLLFMGDIKYMFYIFSLPILIIIYMCLIDITFFTYKSVDTLGVLNKTLFINTLIKWDEVYEVYNIRGIYPASGYIIKVLFKYIVLIKGKDKKIIISNWTKNSKELIKLVVAECKKRDISIDTKIEKIIE